MSKPQSQRFWIGLFVLGALLLLGALTTLFGGFPDFFRKYHSHTVRFDYAPGVAPGTPVRLSGVRIGEVKRVVLDDHTGEVIVHIVVEKHIKLYPDDRPVLVPGILGGDTSIDFRRSPPAEPVPVPRETIVPPPAGPEAPPPDPVPGTQKAEPPPPDPVPLEADGEEASQAKPEERVPVKPGTEFKGERQPDVSNVLKAMSELVGPTQESLRLIRQSLQRLEKTAPIAEDTMREYRELARETRRTLPELRRTNDEINVTARTWGKLGERLDVLVQTNQDKLIKALDSLNDNLARIASVLSDENQRNLAAILKNTRTASENFPSISQNADALMKEGRASLKRLDQTMTRANEVLNDLQKAAKPLADRGDSITKNLDESAVKLNQTLNDVRDLLRAFGQGDGTLGRLLSDPALYNNLDQFVCRLNRLLPGAERILRDLEVFADKLARHPESIGLGGAIRPSSGLKEAPSTIHPHGPRR